MGDRRTFLKKAAAITAGMTGVVAGGWPASDLAAEANAEPPPGPSIKTLCGTGEHVPDTLDLADHGRMALHGMLGTLDPALDYECFFLTLFDVHPAYMLHWSSMISGVMPKYVEALPLLRLMSGSDAEMDLQNGFMEAMLENMAEDGLVYDRTRPDRPWNTGVGYGKKDWDEDYSCLAGDGRLLAGLTYWHQWTGDERWRQLAQKTAERMHELAVVEGDVAFYPNPGLGNDFSYPRKTGWTHKRPPERANEGFEGATLFYLFQPLKGFARYYALTGDERFRELSRKFVNLGMQPKFWGAANDVHAELGAQRAHFGGHFHGTLGALRGLLDYALVADDSRLKAFVRDGYEFARHHGIHRLGVFAHSGDSTEGCAIADMIGLAVALSDAGLGDYWDDVERYARNGLISAQATDKDELLRVSQAGRHRPKDSGWGGQFDWRFGGNNKGVLEGQETTDRVIERSIGAFGHLLGAHSLVPMLMHCCTANASQGLYYAWEGIVRNRGGSVDVNLWLNRRSPWLDVASGLPYEGQLLLRNKGMRRIGVRKPDWVRAATLRCRIDGRDVRPTWTGNRMVFDGLRGNECLQLQVPLTIDKAEYGIVNLNARAAMGSRYVCRFKGNTAIDVEMTAPREAPRPDWYRIFRREGMQSDSVPIKPLPGYVHPDKLVGWLTL